MTTAKSAERINGADEALKQALLSRTRPPRPTALSTSLSFGWRALLRIKHVPEQLFDVTLFPIIFLLMFTYLFGGAMFGSTGEYLQFLLPGILAQTVVMITMYTGIDLNKDISTGVFDRIRTLPIWRPSALVGALLVDAVRYSIASVIMIVLGLILGFRPEGGLLGMLAAVALLLLFSFSLSWIWTTLGIVVRTEKALMGISMMVLFPLTFVSNVFVDPRTMPSWLQPVVEINPISLLVTAMRGLAHGDATFGQIGWVLLWSAVLMLVFIPITMHMYRRRQ